MCFGGGFVHLVLGQECSWVKKQQILIQGNLADVRYVVFHIFYVDLDSKLHFYVNNYLNYNNVSININNENKNNNSITINM